LTWPFRLMTTLVTCPLAAGLRQFDTRRRFITSLVTAAVSDERRHSAHLFLVEVPAHHSAPSSAALAKGSRADCIQAISPRVQVSARVCTCIPYWWALSGGRCWGSSATLFQFIFIIDCQPHPTPYRRWPSFPGRRCTCLEQSARSCHFRTFRSSLPVRLKTHLFNISYPVIVQCLRSDSSCFGHYNRSCLLIYMTIQFPIGLVLWNQASISKGFRDIQLWMWRNVTDIL